MRADEATDEAESQGPGTGDLPESDEHEDAGERGVDWVVFLVRVSGFAALGAMLITSVDLSLNQGADWVTVMRLAMLPFVGGVLLLAAAELIDRRGD